jgi:leucyl aminopeptidase
MRVSATTEAPLDTRADTIAVGVFEGEGVAHDLDGKLGALLDAGEARPAFRHLAVTHADGARWILAGLGGREDFDAERARRVATTVHGRANELGTRTLCWELPHRVSDDVAAGLVEGTVLAAWSFTGLKTSEEPANGLEALIVSAHHDVGARVETAALGAEAANAARALQETPANLMTPTALAEHAQAFEAEGVKCEVWDRARIEAAGMGAFAAVARGSREEPRLIVLRHEPADARGPVLGLVGKAVTFDSGGYSIKAAAGMEGMKFDMSGGAAVIEATAAIARLGLPLRVLSVVGATENLVDGQAVKPGDVVTAMTGTTIEVNNTDAEGRLVLADCLAHAVALGAERLVDVATLTGGVVAALGSIFAGLMANDDAWAAAVTAAGAATGERLWRLPLDPEYDEAIKGRWGDIVNSTPDRKAHPIMGGQFLARFVGDVPWAHLDIAGVANDANRAWAPKGGTGFGTRLLIRLAADLARSSA